MPTAPPSSTPPDGPNRATLRARSRANPVRPEVIEALDDLERSLGDVARWEQLLTGKEAAPDWQRPDETAEPRPRHLGPQHLAAGAADAPWMANDDGLLDEMVGDLHEAIRSLDDRIDEIRPDGPITFDDPEMATSGFEAGYELGQMPVVIETIEAPPLLPQARTVTSSRSLAAAAEEQAEIDKRRRNGRMLTWTGLALLVGLGALFLLPGEDDGDGEPPATVPTVTVETPTSELLPGLPFDPGALTTTLPTAPPATTPTTVPATTRTTKAPGTTPTAPVTTPTSSLGQPGPPPTPVTTVTSTTSTTASTTTTSTTLPPVSEL